MFEPHQQRVIDEKRELDEKATKLSDFIGNSPVFDSLDAAEQERMKEQCEIMVPCVCIERLRKMADMEDEYKSISAGGLAADLGMLNEERPSDEADDHSNFGLM